ncbi:hypothetical protein BJ508DRAFT_306136 [Ascobolus immersus RN42]|uniref:F-box domain-containing protein n=1 Tax=Ascobolus immersus RN42 TaxID=1160509 RepID=A0A3N4I7D1_ASCIM|nr:hypothetical protein BJ508DRAFT_306136 [Ascobolus immersus RN42]
MEKNRHGKRVLREEPYDKDKSPAQVQTKRSRSSAEEENGRVSALIMEHEDCVPVDDTNSNEIMLELYEEDSLVSGSNTSISKPEEEDGDDDYEEQATTLPHSEAAPANQSSAPQAMTVQPVAGIPLEENSQAMNTEATTLPHTEAAPTFVTLPSDIIIQILTETDIFSIVPLLQSCRRVNDVFKACPQHILLALAKWHMHALSDCLVYEGEMVGYRKCWPFWGILLGYGKAKTEEMSAGSARKYAEKYILQRMMKSGITITAQYLTLIKTQGRGYGPRLRPRPPLFSAFVQYSIGAINGELMAMLTNIFTEYEGLDEWLLSFDSAGGTLERELQDGLYLILFLVLPSIRQLPFPTRISSNFARTCFLDMGNIIDAPLSQRTLVDLTLAAIGKSQASRTPSPVLPNFRRAALIEKAQFAAMVRLEGLGDHERSELQRIASCEPWRKICALTIEGMGEWEKGSGAESGPKPFIV